MVYGVEAIRVAGIDSGMMVDAFAMVGATVKGGKIYINNAKRWLGKAYLTVEDEVSKIHAKTPYDNYMVEVNNVGIHVYEVLRHQKGLPVIPVSTTADIKDMKKKYSPRIMDKNEMAALMVIWFEQGIIVFPEKLNAELEELKRQKSVFGEFRTPSGKKSYRAEGTDHDDLVMALMMVCFRAKQFISYRRGTSGVGTMGSMQGGKYKGINIEAVRNMLAARRNVSPTVIQEGEIMSAIEEYIKA